MSAARDLRSSFNFNLTGLLPNLSLHSTPFLYF